jgi:MYXO-CTERM domain-containing protein
MKYPSFFHTGVLRADFDTDPEAVFVDSVIDATTFEDVMLLAVPPDGGAPGSDAAAPRADSGSSLPRDSAVAAERKPLSDGRNPVYDFDAGETPDDPTTSFDDKPYTIKSGCSIGGTGSPGWLALPLAFALLRLRRRR